MLVALLVFMVGVVFYNFCLIITDAAFNRMIRRNIQEWRSFKEWEWVAACLIGGGLFFPWLFLIVIDAFFALLYIAVTCFCFWDLLFGKLVYGEWTVDRPKAKVFGRWIKVGLWWIVFLRLVVGIICFIYLLWWAFLSLSYTEFLFLLCGFILLLSITILGLIMIKISAKSYSSSVQLFEEIQEELGKLK